MDPRRNSWVANASVLEGKVKVGPEVLKNLTDRLRPTFTQTLTSPQKKNAALSSKHRQPPDPLMNCSKMADSDIFRPELAGRPSSPALSDISELTVLSRSPSPVPEYRQSFRAEIAFPLTPPSRPGDLRATNGRFTLRNAKRASTPDAFRFVLCVEFQSFNR